MNLLGILIAIGAALTFAAVGAFVLWGSERALRDEVATSYISQPPALADRLITWLCLILPALAVVVFCLLTALRIFQILL
jgi:diacylglycerol kinase